MYRIIGADQNEYGPASAEQVRDWIARKRADAQTKVLADGESEWRPLGSFPEFAAALEAAVAAKAGGSVPPPALAPAPAGSGQTSGMAIASLVLGVLGVLSCGVTALVGVVLGIMALVKINRSRGALRGEGLAIAGIVVSGMFLLVAPIAAGLLLPALAKAKSKAQHISCMNNTKQLALGLLLYANDEEDLLPAADRWCDAIRPYAPAETVFRCPAASDGERSHYAFNARLAGVKLSEIREPMRTVLVFEGSGGWNASGGPDSARPQSRHAQRNVVAFADGHCEVLGADRLRDLVWEP